MKCAAAVLPFAFIIINAIVSLAQNAPKAVDPIASYGRLPLTFEKNLGQTDPGVHFLARGRWYTLFLTETETVLVPQHAAEPGTRDRSSQRAIVRMKLARANAAPIVEALDPFAARSNYFIGNDPAKWHTDVPNFARVAYRDVYPGVDLIYYGNQQQLEYDFVVAPGADPGAISLRISRDQPAGQGLSLNSRLKIAANGDLIVPVDGGQVRFHRPVAYQLSNNKAGSRRLVRVRFVVRAYDQVGIRLSTYDRSKVLIIDPVLVYSTYLEGSLQDQGYGIAVDSSGSAYITGNTNSPDFPTTAGAFKTSCGSDGTCNVAGSHGADNANTDVFVTKLKADGSGLVYSTYLGGALKDAGRAIAVDASGNAYVAGFTNSLDFPITAGAYQQSCGPVIGRNNFTCSITQTTTCGFGGTPDAFVTKLNPTGSALVYSTYLGGSNNDVAGAIAVNAAGEAYVAGGTDSNQSVSACPGNGTSLNENFAFPTTANGFMAAPAPSGTPWPASGPSWGTFSKLGANGTTLLYSTYIGAASGPFLTQGASGVAVDASGDGYVTGQTNGSTFPTTPGVVGPVIDLGHSLSCGGPPCGDAFVQRYGPSQSGAASLVYSTFLGGSGDDFANGIAVDGSGNAYVTGGTGSNSPASADFPTTPGAFQTSCPATPCQPKQGWVTKLNPTATALVYSSYLGGQGSDTPLAITIDSQSDAYVTGQTNELNFPVTGNAIQPNLPTGQGTHGFVTVFNPSGSGLMYSSFLGGSNADTPQGIALDFAKNIYVAGTTLSSDFSTTQGAFQTTCTKCGANGSFFSAAFVSKISAPTGSLLIVKKTIGGDGTFNFTGTGTGIPASFQITTSGNTGSYPMITNLAPGSGYSVSEQSQTGWDPTTATCTSSTPGAITIVAGQTTTCTFTNTKRALILNRKTLSFGYNGSLITSPQAVAVSFTNGSGVAWTASSNQSNITVSPTSGTGNGTLQITAGPGASGVVTVTAPGATNSPQQIQVNVSSIALGVPFGSFDTPVNNTIGIAGAIPVTGWALDNIEVTSVGVYREPVGNEPTQSNGLVYIGNGTFVVGARPDVEAKYPNAPLNYRAGWGYLLLTNFLPNSGGSPGPGNGTCKLHAIATNKAGMTLDLGTRTITVDNAHASKPFGTIDTPDQGANVSGSAYVNFGWALTQNPYCIPTDGSTLTVWIDGLPVGHPTYNQRRSDIVTLFPGLCNTNGAVGFFYIDITTITNGVHTISWVVYDNANRGDGIGSRYFTVQNTGTGVAAPEEPIQPAWSDAITLRRGFEVDGVAELLAPDDSGAYSIDMEELGRIELQVGVTTGHLLVNDERRSLPIGSTLRGGAFYWHAGPGFLGDYHLIFGRPDDTEVRVRISVRAKSYAATRSDK